MKPKQVEELKGNAWANSLGRKYRRQHPDNRQVMQKAPTLVWADLTSQVLGDPPIGRRAIDRRKP